MSTRDLFALAREDAPDASSRDAMWRSIEASLPALGAGAGAGAATSAAAPTSATTTAGTAATGTAATSATSAAAGVGALGAAKASFLGALIGSAFSVTAAIAVVHAYYGPPPAARSAIAATAVAPAEGPSFRAPSVLTPQSTPAAPLSTAHVDSVHAPSAPLDTEDALSQEVSLVASARGALLRRDAETCLAALRAARALPVRQLEPEELGLEARALRMQGHFEEASAVESSLRARYPRHVLGGR